ncbi:helix-turn-helix domain-containing protein [Butyrivibrio hungatei]|uniref:HTH domain-containing protein n=1 Tax=Butyrivibrio hungatei TaxID=185008 RepID=A0A1D9P606_9FIRM|nr:helix-turn-helix transcriptional regulator [Butyrivibrio hungatei]AOZ97764.1 HTH domain-containing protein [Butyrivibrio hungatei]
MLDMKSIGKKIKDARTKKNMTQLELADIVGVSYQAVSNWERGNTMPDITKLPDIAKALELNIADLLGDNEAANAVNKVTSDDDTPLSASEIAEIAPILPPQVITDNVKKTSEQAPLNIEVLLELAPFLDDEYLDGLVLNSEITNIDDIVELAPFISDFALDKLVERANPDNLEDLIELAPFLSRNALDLVVDKAIANGSTSDLVAFAPFLEKKSMKKIVDCLLHSNNPKDISSFAPFL